MRNLAAMLAGAPAELDEDVVNLNILQDVLTMVNNDRTTNLSTAVQTIMDNIDASPEQWARLIGNFRSAYNSQAAAAAEAVLRDGGGIQVHCYMVKQNRNGSFLRKVTASKGVGTALQAVGFEGAERLQQLVHFSTERDGSSPIWIRVRGRDADADSQLELEACTSGADGELSPVIVLDQHLQTHGSAYDTRRRQIKDNASSAAVAAYWSA